MCVGGVCVCVENSKITWLHSAKKRRKNCWNVEIGLRLSWILNDERAAKGNGQGGVAGGNGARRCSNTVRVRSGNGHRVPRRARSPLTAAVWLVSVSLTLPLSLSLKRAVCYGFLRVWVGGGGALRVIPPWPRPEGLNSLANTRKINQQQRKTPKKTVGQ